MKKKKMVIASVFFIIIILIVATLLIVFLFKNTNKEDKIVKLSKQEVKYLDDELVVVLNKLNNIDTKLFINVQEDKQSSNENSQNQNATMQNESGNQSQSSGSQSSGSQSSDKNTEAETSSSVESSTKKYTIKNTGILTNDNSSIDWNYIKNRVENLSSAWSNIVINLHQLNVENSDILGFSNKLDELIISVKKEDKPKTIDLLATLYSYLPKYIEKIEEDENKRNLSYTKANIVNSYNLVENEKWDDMKVQVATAQKYFSNVMNSVNQEANSQTKYAKIYVVLNELNNAIANKDKELYYIKYKNLLEYIENA